MDTLTENKRQQFMAIVAKYIVENFGYLPNRAQKITVGQAIVTLFPSYKVEKGPMNMVEL